MEIKYYWFGAGHRRGLCLNTRHKPINLIWERMSGLAADSNTGLIEREQTTLQGLSKGRSRPE